MNFPLFGRFSEKYCKRFQFGKSVTNYSRSYIYIKILFLLEKRGDIRLV